MEHQMLITEPQSDYELLDSGEGEKLERYGRFVISRPDPQALWPKMLPQEEWHNAHAVFVKKGASGSWKRKEGVPERWNIELGGSVFEIEPSPFKHVGVFPEQLSNWQWIEEKIGGIRERKPKVLNLFGYTGGATLAAARAGAEVVHVDASKPSVTRARENAERSGLGTAPIRWILDDAYKFVQREIRRGSTYDGIVMDPPVYGRGAKGEAWKIEDKLVPLLQASQKLLSKEPVFFVLNGYASGYTASAYKNALDGALRGLGGSVESGELAIRESKGMRLLPAGIFARWSR